MRKFLHKNLLSPPVFSGGAAKLNASSVVQTTDSCKLFNKDSVSQMKSALFMLFSFFLYIGVYAQGVQPPTYCTNITAANNANYGMGIQNVTLGTVAVPNQVNNTSSPGQGTQIYFDYTNLSLKAAANELVNFSIRGGNSNQTRFRIYIDYNNDGTFNTTSPELVYTSVNLTTPNTVVNDTFRIPSTQTPGVYRIRVASDGQGNIALPCGPITYSADYEDYTLVVTNTSTDITAYNFTSPTNFSVGNNTIGIRIYNLHSTAVNSLSIGYQLNNNTPVTQSLSSLSIAQGVAYNATFSTVLNIPAAGTYTVRAWVNNPNGTGNGNTVNDTIFRTFTVCDPFSGTYTINPSGSGNRNFTTFASAMNTLACGGVTGAVTFNVAAGTYVEQVAILPVPGASSTNTITIDGGTGNAASRILSFNFPATPNNYAVLHINGADYLRIRNITIASTSSDYGYGILFNNQADNNIVENCIIDLSAVTSTNSANSAGINFSGSATNTFTNGNNGNYNLIQNNEIKGGTTGGPYRGINFYGNSSTGPGTNNQFNSFIGNTITDFFESGIYLYWYMNNTTIARNSISRPNRNSSTTISGVYGQYSQNTVIEGNRIFNPFGGEPNSNSAFYGINFQYNYFVGNRIVNNAIYNVNGNGTHYGIYDYFNYTSPISCPIYNNTISLDFGTAKTNTNADYGIWSYMAVGVSPSYIKEIKNNIVTLTRAGSGTPTRIGLYLQDAFTLVSDNNLWRVNATGANNVTVYQVSTNFATLADWQASNSAQYDQNSTNINPLYTNLLTNVTPTNCGLNNRGTPVSLVSTDLTGATRGSVPDMGAYEFSSPAGINASVSAFVNPGSIMCSGSQTITVKLKNAGTVNLTSASIGWDVNSSVQTPFSWTGSLAPNAEVNVNIGTFNISAPTNTFRAYTSNPNNTTDVCIANDTFTLGPKGTGMSGTFTIDPLGSGPTNFLNFATAVNALKSQGVCGNVTLNVAAATYNEKVVITPIPGASATSRVIFDGGAGNAATRVIQFTNSSDYIGVHLDGADFITIKNLTIRPNVGITTNVMGILLRNSADNNIIDSNIIDFSAITGVSTTNVGIAFSSSTTQSTSGGSHGKDNIIRGNQILGSATGGAYRGISIYNTSTSNYALLSGNRVVGNTIQDFYESGIYIYFVQNAVVTDNNISRPNRTASTTINGIYGYYDDFNLYERNRIHNPFGGATASTSTFYGIYSYGGYTLNSIRFANNLIYNVNGNGSHWGIYVYYHYTPTILYNTISFDNVSSTSTGTTRAIDMWSFYSTALPGVVRNNIISITRGGTGTKHGLYLNQYYFQSNNNVVFTSGTNTNFGYFSGPSGTATFATLAAWQATTTQDANSSNLNPSFTSPGTGNFQPTTVALNNTGFATTLVTSDINGLPRNISTPDVGAYEWGIACSGSPTVTGVTIQGATSGLCGGETVTLTVQYDVRSGLTFQWQSSPNGSSWTNVSGATSFTFVTPPISGPVYYRCAVTCGGNTANSSAAFITTGLNGVYTINPSGSGPNNFTSFTSAVTTMNNFGICGPVTFNVAAGTYNERVLLGSIPGASATKRVIFNGGNGNATTRVIQYAASTTELPIVYLNGTDYVTFKNLTVKTSSTNAGFGVLFRNNADYNVIDSCIIDLSAVTSLTTNAIGIVFSGSDANYSTTGSHGSFNMISNNLITGSSTGGPYFGISIYGEATSNPTSNRNNTFLKNEIRDFSIYGMYLYYGHLNTLVSGNSIYRPTRNYSSTIYGIYLYQYPLNFTVENNKIYSPYGATSTSGTFYGIFAGYAYTNPGVIRNNLIYNANGTSGTAYGIYVTYMSSTRFYHNTIAFNDPTAANVSNYGFFLENGYTGTYDQDIKNNIVSITRPASTAGGANNYGLFVSTNHTFTADNNLYFINGANANNFVGSQGSNFASVSAWSAFSGKDANSSVGNPLFASYPTNLTPACVVNSKGANVLGFAPVDFNGSARSSVPDPGAFEITSSAVDASISGLVEPNITNSICSSTPVDIKVRIQNTGTDTLVSATINWNVNSVTQTPASWTGSLLPGQTAVVTVGSWNFAAQTQNNVAIYCSAPNGTTDACSLNDSIRFSKGAGLNGTYTINPSGGNFVSFNDAVSFMQTNGICGPVTFNVAPATYTGRVVLTQIPGSSTTNTVTFNGTSVDDVIIEEPFSGTITDYSIVQFNGVDNVIFKNITVRSSNVNYGWGFLIRNSSDNNIIENCVIDHRNSTSISTANIGIVFSNSGTSYTTQGNHANGTIVRNNRLIGSASGGTYWGIYYYGSTNAAENLNNVIEGNEIQDFYNYGINVYGYCINLSIKNNKISRPNRTSNTTLAGIYSQQGYSRKIIGNRIFDMFKGAPTSTSTFYGIYQTNETTSAYPSITSNNVMYRNDGAGVLYGVYNASAYYVSYSHNNIIFDVNATNTTNTSTIYGFYSANSTSSTYPLDFKNNIVIIKRPGGTRYGIYLTSNPYYVVSNNNLITVTGTGSTNYYGYQAVNYATLATWRTGTSKDLNSISGIDPIFTSAEDFTPTNPAVNGTGTPSLYVSMPVDMNGKNRNTTLPDVGAVEWTPICVGADLVAGTPYQGVQRGGSLVDFDHLLAGQTITMEMTPPTAFSNATFGTSWTIENFYFNTVNLTAPAPGDTSTTYPGASNGKLTFTPSSAYTDSMFVMNFKIKSLTVNECESQFSRYVFVAPLPVADFDSSTVACFGQETTINNLSTVSSGSLTYDWSFGDTINTQGSQATNPSFQFSGPGLFSVKLTTTTNLGYIDTVTKIVRVSHLPTTSFSNSSTCDGDSVRFINNTSLQGPAQTMTYDWDLSGGDMSTLTNPSKKYANHGNYTVKLTATTALGCKASQTRNIVVFPLPDADFSASNVCKGETSVFTNNSTIATGNIGSSWTFGDGNTSTSANPTNVYAATGSYNVKLVAYSAFGCKDSITKSISVVAKPKADFATSSYCDNDSTMFVNSSSDNGGPAITYNWSFGDNSNSSTNASSFNHQYSEGNYTVVLNVTNGSCSDSKQMQITIAEAPEASFMVNNTVCQGNATDFTNTSSNGSGTPSYSWMFGSSGTSAVKDPSYTFPGAGTFDVWLKVNSGSCSDSVKMAVTVNPNPVASFTFAYTSLVNQRQVNYTPTNSTYSTYLWNFGDGNNSNQLAPVYSYLSNGPFQVTLNVTDANGCVNTSAPQTVSFNVSAGQVMSKSFSFDVYPNPFRNQATIAYNLVKGGNVEVKLFDMTGKEIAVLANAAQNEGSYELSFSAAQYNLAAGTYFVRLSLNGEVQTKQIVQVK